MPAKNDAELHAFVMNDLEKIADEIGKYLVTQVQQTIDEEVYEAYLPKVYDRLYMDGGFIGSWINYAGRNGENEVIANVFSNPYLMEFNPEKYQHGSEYGGDRRFEMAEDIRYGKGYDWGFDMERDFWTPIEDFVEDGTEIDNTLEIGFKKRNIKFIRI
jgi:hypothetical protein